MDALEMKMEGLTMALRTGSIGGSMRDLDPEIRRALLEDYQTAHRRDHCSRTDFADGWLALLRRLKGDPEIRRQLLVRNS